VYESLRYSFIEPSFHLHNRHEACLIVCQIFVFEQRALLILRNTMEVFCAETFQQLAVRIRLVRLIPL
jgi:hypothetical protein